MIFSHFKFLEANLREGEGGTLMVGPGRQLASLRHCFLPKCRQELSTSADEC